MFRRQARVRLVVSGDGLRSVGVPVAEVDAVDELLVRVELAEDRCCFAVEPGDPDAADRFELHDATGGPVPLELRRGGFASSTTSAPLAEGRSFVLAAPQGAWELVLYRGTAEVARRPALLIPGPVRVLR